jgi:hypothetical protein
MQQDCFYRGIGETNAVPDVLIEVGVGRKVVIFSAL